MKFIRTATNSLDESEAYNGMRKLKQYFGSLRFWFLDTFGKRSVDRTTPAHGDWQETCGWEFRGRFYRCDRTTNIKQKVKTDD